jgi:drug/metabolite transporter (DMT)-like permease
VARLLGRRWPRTYRDLARLALYSLFGVVINQLCFVEGLSRTTPSHASILMSAIPVGTLLFAVLAGQERLTVRKGASLVVAVAGVVLIVQPSAAELAGASVLGDLLVVINALSYSLFLVLSKRVLGRVDPLAATALLMAFGAVGMLLPGLPALLRFDPAPVSGRTWLLGALIIVGPTALAYLLNYWALARVESSLVAFFIYLQPVIATGLAVWWLGDRVDAAMVGGAALIFLAVYLALRRDLR